MAGVRDVVCVLWVGALISACLTSVCVGAEGATAEANLPSVGRYDVFEVSLTAVEPGNPFVEGQASAVFTSPDGRKVAVEGFFAGEGRWLVRFAPNEMGMWSYKATLLAGGKPTTAEGRVRCVGSDRPGPLRLSQRNPYRLEYETGRAFYPIGVQTCGYFQAGFDGPAADGGDWRTVSAEQWWEAFDGAVNLVRWQLGAGTKAGCALALIPEGGPADRYDLELAAKMDDLMRLQKGHGVSHIMILYQDMSLWGSSENVFGRGRQLSGYKALDAPNLPDQERLLRYVVARWGAYVDVWELFNEDAYAPNDYLAHLAKVIRKADPYDHPMTTNYARPDQDWCEIVTWHEYMGMPANEVDAYVAGQIGMFKAYGKPVVNTEFGNQGWLSNYDPIKWRIAVWAAYMNEGSILFWGMSGRKTVGRRPYRGNANAYLGEQSRQYFRTLADFTRDLPIDMRPVACGYTEHNDLRLYGLSNGKTSVVYVHHFSDHTKAYECPDPMFVQTGPGTFGLTWIDPADGKVVRTQKRKTRGQFITTPIPPVTIDLACRIDRVD